MRSLSFRIMQHAEDYMSKMIYQYYRCNDESLIADILRAAINSEEGMFILDVYSKSPSGGVKCQTTGHAADMPSSNMPKASFGLGAAASSALACVLFMPIISNAGIVAYASLVFMSGLIGAWAAGCFSRTTAPSRLRKALAKLQPGHLIIACRANRIGQQNLQQALGRYSAIVPLTAKSKVFSKNTETGQDIAS